MATKLPAKVLRLPFVPEIRKSISPSLARARASCRNKGKSKDKFGQDAPSTRRFSARACLRQHPRQNSQTPAVHQGRLGRAPIAVRPRTSPIAGEGRPRSRKPKRQHDTDQGISRRPSLSGEAPLASNGEVTHRARTSPCPGRRARWWLSDRIGASRHLVCAIWAARKRRSDRAVDMVMRSALDATELAAAGTTSPSVKASRIGA